MNGYKEECMAAVKCENRQDYHGALEHFKKALEYAIKSGDSAQINRATKSVECLEYCIPLH